MKKAKTKQIVKPYERTPHEQGVMEAYKTKRTEKPPAPSVKVVVRKDGKATIEPNHPEHGIAYHLIAKALGTTDYDFMNGLLTQLCNDVSQGGKIDERGLNFMLSVVKGVEPRDQVEAMLAAQMAVTHNATMTFGRRLAHVETIPQQDSAERAFNKLARTFAAARLDDQALAERGGLEHGELDRRRIDIAVGVDGGPHVRAERQSVEGGRGGGRRCRRCADRRLRVIGAALSARRAGSRGEGLCHTWATL